MKKKFTEEQIIAVLREKEISDASIREVCRKHSIAEHTFFRWRRQYGGTEVSDTLRLSKAKTPSSRSSWLSRPW